MSGETERAPSGWTTDTLKDYVDTRMAAQEKAIVAALAAVDKAIGKADVANEKRFESVNEFRAQLNDMVHTLMPRKESEIIHERANQRIAELAARVNAIDVSAGSDKGHGEGVRLTLGTMAGLIAAAASIVVIVNVMIALLTK